MWTSAEPCKEELTLPFTILEEVELEAIRLPSLLGSRRGEKGSFNDPFIVTGDGVVEVLEWLR